MVGKMVERVANIDLLDGMAVFVGVVKAGSFTAAAHALGHSTSYVSKEVTRLEKRLGSRLLNRTTRTISLTNAGRAYYERCNQIVIDAQNAERSINQLQEEPSGLLRVNAPGSFGSKYLLDVLPEFMHRYPDIKLEVEFNDRLIDVVAEGYDVVIRVGEIKDSNLIARKFTSSRSVVVASPEYLKRRGTPQNVEELTQHDCIAYSLLPAPTQWVFNKGGKRSSVTIEARAMCNSANIEIAMVMKGIGITRVPLFTCEKEVDSGELQVILDDYDHIKYDVYAVYPHRQYLTAKVRAFVDFVVDAFE
ncbi:MAG: LysR family transcriptional regulator [endosymbiont of Galathealinum brachiosum]|uniref:LysR family transcriptional regulator n=1 Tax=endosymbiont of Galathealinum brachiosum TaxID=2200906 RepID=A0A370DGT6_9GAMM|nr:MAG: LysR family transcriptional regulator [endosymbiont of Galathealinum brachiosum]